MTIQDVKDRYPGIPFVFLTGRDDAIIGVDIQNERLIYSSNRIISQLEKDMGIDNAIDYFDYNIAGAYYGERTPIYCDEL